MNLKQFAGEAGVEIVECGPGWGGRYGYTTKDMPNSTVCGFRTKDAAYKAWLEDTFGELAAKAVARLLTLDDAG